MEIQGTPPPRRLRPDVTTALLGHGLRPLPTTSPALLRDQVRDLYLVEIRRLRDLVRQRAFPMHEYAARVTGLRGRYPLLSLPLECWYEQDPCEPLR